MHETPHPHLDPGDGHGTSAPDPGRGQPTVVVFAGGDRPGPDALVDLPVGAFVIAADSGLHLAQEAGAHVDLVIGDLDSVDRAALAIAEARGATVERHPEAKDRTDLELALARSAELGARRVVVVGGGGGRLDHLLANALLLSAADFGDLRIEARFGRSRVHVVRDRADLAGRPGELVSLLPIGGPARGVTTTGLLYPLVGETLWPGSTRGVSNELATEVASVDIEVGVVLAVVPGEQGTHVQRFRDRSGPVARPPTTQPPTTRPGGRA